VADRSLAEIAEAIVSSWGPETIYATDEPSRKPGSRCRNQCGTTALVLQDWLGGKVLGYSRHAHAQLAAPGHHLSFDSFLC
jgi:hypothetical protein